MKIIKCGVIGVGYLGRFHAEKYAKLPNAQLIGVCDTDADKSNEIAQKHGVLATQDYHELLGKVDAVSIVTPTQSHHQIAKVFLEHGVHVLLEKPITNTVAEADELIKIADKNKLVLQIGHLERFNSVVNALEKYLDRPRFIQCSRLAPFKLRSIDVSVVLDLMIHDIDLIQYLVGSPIKQIHANGACVLSDQIDIANARIQFENHCVANVTASRVYLKQERRLRLFQPEAYISVDLQGKQLAIHRKGTNEMFPGIPEIICEEQAFEQGDALRDEIIAFLDSIENQKPPVVSGIDGKRALATAIEITNIVNQQMELFKKTQAMESAEG
ncbi:MAG TPA: Gfo/Idh/MocA family oxidoreductase [Gammaproteobacteria bacterium]|nr:Gfo/Idh/MocA family oxidoreductase [Gammaproteobacteria bacterium]